MPLITPRRRLLAGAAAIAAGGLLVPACVRAAAGVSGRINIGEHPGGIAAAIGTGQPLYAPPGVYQLPSGLALTQPLDLMGDSARPPTFEWGKGDAFIPGAAPVRFQHCKFAAGPGYLVNMNETAVEVPYIGVFDCTFEDVGGVIGWPTTRPLPGSRLGQLEVRRVDAKNVGRGIVVQGGTTVRFEVEEYSCDGYTRFGLLIGPIGGRYQADMVSGTVRHVKVLNGRLKGDASTSNKNNNNGVYIAGRNVELHDVHIENLGDGTRHDTEGLYTKVVHLRAAGVRLVNAGGKQAFYGCKGSDPKSNRVAGADTVFENLEIICAGEHKGNGVWFQAHEGATFANVRTVGLTGSALRMHKSAEGPLIIRDWHDLDGRRTKASVFDLRGRSRVELADCTVTPPYANV
ncbi:MAG: hypothetical protein ACREEV_10485, partial [Dongiaceae bacterium]